MCWVKFGGLEFLLFVLNLVFILRPLNFMIAMVRNLRLQKKTETELFGRRSAAFTIASAKFWFFILHFATPNH